MCKHYQIKVTGKVQGVWFRKYTMEKAKSLGLKGWVKNLSDGSVWVEVESENEKALQSFIEWLHVGSPLSRPTGIEVVSIGNCKSYTDFIIQK